MKILYFYQYFSTPKGSWGTRVYEFARNWVKEGHEVTVVTSVYSKSDISADKLIEDQYFEGVHVKVLNIRIDNKQHIIRRMWTFVQYMILSSYYALTIKADIVIASSGPITVGVPGLVARYLRGRKLVFETRDLWPDGAIELGIVQSRLVKKLAYWLEKKCYEASSYIVTLSPGMTRHIQKRFRMDNIDDVTNAANIELFSTPKALPTAYRLRPRKYAIYTGNIGMVNNSYWLFDAAKELKSMGRDDIAILLIGEGQWREELVERAERENVTNFLRISLMSKTDLVPYVQNALASLVPLKGTPVLDTSSPNKFFESLAAGVPVIQNTNGWMKEFLEENRVGFTLNPDAAIELANCLIWMDSHPEDVKDMGQRASELARKQFDKDFLAKKMLSILETLHDG